MNFTLESETQRLTLSTNYGTAGTQGAAGKSAYQIWLDNGHTGTESDFLASLVGSGAQQHYTAGTDISALRVLALDSANHAVYASQSTVAPLGVSTTGVLQGETVAVAGSDTVVEDPSWNWTPDAFLFCGALGVLTQAAPTTGNWAPIGVALSATRIVVRPLTPVRL